MTHGFVLSFVVLQIVDKLKIDIIPSVQLLQESGPYWFSFDSLFKVKELPRYKWILSVSDVILDFTIKDVKG